MKDIEVECGKEKLIFTVRDAPGGSDFIVLDETFKQNAYYLQPYDFRDDGIFIDIGANIGAVSVLAHRLGAKKIICYEPVPENYDLLTRNLAANGVKAEVHRQAVWSSRTKIKITSRQGGSSSNPNQLATYDGEIVEAETVTLPDILDRFESVAVLKCDTEGAEYEFMMDTALNKKIRKIVLEFHPNTQEMHGKLISTLMETHNFRGFGSRFSGGLYLGERY
jgi:FkbM family methyltransferase